MYNEKIGLIDIGSNTIRLVVYAIDHRFNITELQNIKTPARLSQYLERSKKSVVMSQTGIDLLIEVLQSFKIVADKAGVDKLFPVATAAIRQSDNRDDILAQVKKQVGIEITILSEKQEATFGQYAILHSVDVPDGITIDIGGGSCEVTLFKNQKMVQFHSFPFGNVTLKEQFFKNKKHNDASAVDAVRKYIREQFKSLPWLKKAKLPIVAMSGSARNIAYVHQRLNEYPIAGIQGYHMTEASLNQTLDLFMATDLEDMGNIDGLSNDRVDIIIPANIVFLELLNTVKAPIFILSNQGLREGLVLTYINEHYHSPIDARNNKLRTVQQVADKMNILPEGSILRVNYAIKLYQALSEADVIRYDEQLKNELEFASYLYRFGSMISSEADSQHTFYIISNMDLLGFSHHDRLRLALLSSFKSKSMMMRYLRYFPDWLTEDEIKELLILGGIIKVSDALNDSQTQPIKDLNFIKKSKNKYQLVIYHTAPVVAEAYRTNRHLKHLSRVLDGNLELKFVELES